MVFGREPDAYCWKKSVGNPQEDEGMVEKEEKGFSAAASLMSESDNISIRDTLATFKSFVW